jgi:hypothetical protein
MLEREISGGQYVLIYMCWVLAMVLGFLALVSGRELLLTVLAVQQVDLKVVGLIDKLVFFVMGVIGLCIVVLSEGYLRTGAKKGQIVGRIGLVFGVELLALFVFDLGRLLVPDVADAARPDVTQTVMSLVIGGLGLWVYWKRRIKK